MLDYFLFILLLLSISDGHQLIEGLKYWLSAQADSNNIDIANCNTHYEPLED